LVEKLSNKNEQVHFGIKRGKKLYSHSSSKDIDQMKAFVISL